MGVPNPAADAFFLYAFAPFFVAMWFGISAMLRKLNGFSWETSKTWRDEPRQASQYFTSARMGMTNFNGCLHIHRVRGGFLLQISRIFGGGSRYVADDEISELEPDRSWLGRKRLTCVIAGETVTFQGKGGELLLRYLASGGDELGVQPAPDEPPRLADR